VLEGKEEEKEEEKANLSLSKTTINNEDQNQIKKKENEDSTTQKRGQRGVRPSQRPRDHPTRSTEWYRGRQQAEQPWASERGEGTELVADRWGKHGPRLRQGSTDHVSERWRNTKKGSHLTAGYQLAGEDLLSRVCRQSWDDSSHKDRGLSQWTNQSSDLKWRQRDQTGSPCDLGKRGRRCREEGIKIEIALAYAAKKVTSTGRESTGRI